MKKIKELIKKVRENSYQRVLIELILGTLLFNVNSTVGILVIMIFLAEIVVAKPDNMLFIYLFLSFFDEVLQLDCLGGSISRIIMVVIGIRLSINVLKNKIKPDRHEIGVGLFFLVSFIVGIITYKNINTEVLIILFNIFIFILFSMNIKLKTTEEVENFIEKLLFTIVIAVLNSVIYGLIGNSFMKELDGENIVYRFKGTYEPNFMSMFINLGIVSILSLKNKKADKKIPYLLCSILIIANILTVSMTGLAAMCIVLFSYIIINRKNFKEEIKDIVIIAVITISLFSIIQVSQNLLKGYQQTLTEKNQINVISKGNTVAEQDETQKQEITIKNDTFVIQEQGNMKDFNKEDKKNTESNNLTKRLEFLKEILIKGDLGRFTSGRIPLMVTFMNASFNRPIGNILFGNDAATKKVFSDYFYTDKYSHNSYMDVLYNFGIIGFVIVITYIFKKVHNNIYLKNSLVDNKYKGTIKLIRIMLLIYAFALSLYTKRMFLIFFLL